MSKSYTFAILKISSEAYKEIKDKLIAAEYGHVFHHHDDGDIMAMHGIALQADDHEPGELIVKCHCSCCGASLEVMHGDDDGEVGVIGTSLEDLCIECGGLTPLGRDLCLTCSSLEPFRND